MLAGDWLCFAVLFLLGGGWLWVGWLLCSLSLSGERMRRGTCRGLWWVCVLCGWLSVLRGLGGFDAWGVASRGSAGSLRRALASQDGRSRVARVVSCGVGEVPTAGCQLRGGESGRSGRTGAEEGVVGSGCALVVANLCSFQRAQ